MIYAKNEQKPLAGQPYKEQFTYTLDRGIVALKLGVNVKSGVVLSTGELLNAPIVLQTTESLQHIFDNEYFTQQFLEIGFWSKTFATPITAWRIKVAEGYELPGLVDFVAYG